MISLSEFSEKYMSGLDSKTLRHILIAFSSIAFITIIYAMCFSGFQIVDEFEHLHASWLVSIGKVPYRDFFEHHHPLLWFLSAPIVSLFYDNVSIFYIMRGISFIVSCFTLFYVYKIIRFWGSANSFLFALVLYLVNLITFYNFYQFRPDVFMNFTFISGTYYWLFYMQTKRLNNLVISFICYALSLLFLQKIFPLLLFIEVIFIVLWLQKRIELVSILKSAIPALGIGIMFYIYLVYNHALLDYFNFNYRFNKAMLFYFERGAFWLNNGLFGLYTLAFISALYFYKRKNLSFKIIALLYIAEFLMRTFYFSPHPNYYTLETILAVIILSVWLDILMTKYKPILVLILVLMAAKMHLLLGALDKSVQNYNSYEHYQLSDYVHKNSKSEDYLMNGYDKNFNIYRRDASYYWFGLDMLMPIIEKEFEIDHKVDVNKLILTYKPKFVWVQDYPDLQAYRSYGEQKYSQQFIPEIIAYFYKKTPFENLAILK